MVFTSDLGENVGVPRTLVNNFIVPAAESSIPLPANPDGVARLQTLIQEASRQPDVTPQPVPSPPVIAEQVLGETYILEKNVLGWESFSLAVQEGDEALLRLDWDKTGPGPFTEAEFKLGLDGVQRQGTGPFGMPTVCMGRWEGENVFIAEVDAIGNLFNLRLELIFADDEVTGNILILNFSDTFVIEGKRAGSL